jgi:hypothetical protein
MLRSDHNWTQGLQNRLNLMIKTDVMIGELEYSLAAFL